MSELSGSCSAAARRTWPASSLPTWETARVRCVVRKLASVLEAAAVGVPVEGKGERVKVYIVLKEGETATEEEIIAFCRENLAPYKVPKSVEFRDELPKTMLGKVLRRVLVEEERKRQAEAEN
ncbi:MAG: hypothetical protein OEW09_05220 [Anaerolineae bacterium]|nr:hypothetical protein [Anaerolineae bacterium]